MPRLEVSPSQDDRDRGLYQFLSSLAAQRVERIADTLGPNKGKTLAAIFLVSAAAKTYANLQLHGDEYGYLSQLGSLLLSPQQVPGQHELNALLVWSHNLLVASGVGGAGAAIGELMGSPDIMRGKAENPYRYMSLLLDKTNKEKEGTHHGEFYEELYRLFTLHPDIYRKIIRRWGPICEIGVPEDAPIPGGGFIKSRQLTRYFRHNTPNDTAFLRDTVKAWRTRATISVIMSKDRTVWDYDKATQEQLTKEAASMDNMNSTIDDLQRDKPQKATRFLITNNRLLHPITIVGGDKTQATLETHSQEYYEGKGYQVINAEQKVMERLTDRFLKQKYNSILLVTDQTDDGAKIAQAWLNDYKLRMKANTSLPLIVTCAKEDLEAQLASGSHDAIFVIGSKDELVDQIVGDIASEQQKGNFKSAALEVLMEGRGASNRAENVVRERQTETTSQKGNTKDKIHYVHEILAQELIARLLPDEKIEWDQGEGKAN